MNVSIAGQKGCCRICEKFTANKIFGADLFFLFILGDHAPIFVKRRRGKRCKRCKNKLVFVNASKYWQQKKRWGAYFRSVIDSYSKAIVRQASDNRSVKKRSSRTFHIASNR